MATATDSTTAEKGAKKGGNSKLLIIIGAILLLVIGGGGTYFFLGGESAPVEPEPPGPGVMVPMEAMTLSLADRHYLKVGISVELVDTDGIDEASFEPSKASELIIDTFSNLEVTTLQSDDMRKKLAKDLLKGIQEAYPDTVYDIYLTQFVVQ